MPDLIIKPAATSGNKLILKDQAGGAVLTTADSGVTAGDTILATKTGTETLTNKTLTAPTVADMSNCTFPAGHILKVQHKDDYTGTNSYTGTGMTQTGVGDTITYTAGNKIFIIFQMQYDVSGGGVSVGTQFKIYDETNGAEINQAGNSLGSAYYAWSAGDPGVSISTHHTALYAPSGTSLNVEMYHSCPWGGTAAIQKDRCSLTMMEVQA